MISLLEPNQNIVKTRKWMYQRADWEKFERLISTTIQADTEIDTEEFTAKILIAAEKSIPRTSGKIGPKAVPWWCPEVESAIKQRKKKLRALRKMALTDPRKVSCLQSFQEARASARKVIAKAKKESWEGFIGKISPSSSAADMWQTINKLRGKRQHSTPVLRRAVGYTDNLEEIAEDLAKHYNERSATSSYSPYFQKVKEKAERNCINLSLYGDEIYNEDFTMRELLHALDKGRSVSIGPDSLGYPMLQRLPLSVKSALLQLFNRVWRSGIFPVSWRTGTVVPIPKLNSSELGPDAFRPITLTSCMAKVFERIVNRRLITELELNGRLDKRQHAFRAGRGVDTYFAELEKSLPNAEEHSLIASLDISKAYDTTWRYGILRTLKKWQIRGRMMNMLQSFLSEREFRVRIGSYLSSRQPLENGVPQGSVLSVTLFLIAIQPLFRVIPAGVDVNIYADDILLVSRGRKDQGLHRKLQAAVRAVNKWAKSVGFAISAIKSQILYCSPNARRDPVRSISIDRVAIPKTKQLKILGVTLDRTLTFKRHCELVKKACESRLRILKMVGTRTPRAQRVTMLQVGSAIITSRLLYGIGLISRGGQAALNMLAPMYHKMVRHASGAFVTSPIAAIMAESGTLPFNLLALQVMAKLAIRMIEMDRTNLNLPLVQRVTNQLNETVGMILPNICEQTTFSQSTWQNSKLSIVWDVRTQVRAGDPAEKVRPIVSELLSRRFCDCTVLYTDGSKCDNFVGSGVYGNTTTISVGLPRMCSVFSAEAFAIKAALTSTNAHGEIAILTDSASCLSALENDKSKHPWIQEIKMLANNKPIHFCWIPGHAGVAGNIQADSLAGNARANELINLSIPAVDVARTIKQTIRAHWSSIWFTQRDIKLREVKPDTIRWADCKNTQDQRVLTRLRIGHTKLTHSFLLEKTRPPTCETCGTNQDIRHILLNCRKYETARERYNITGSLYTALYNDEETEDKMLRFLKETNLYGRV